LLLLLLYDFKLNRSSAMREAMNETATDGHRRRRAVRFRLSSSLRL
jgi:hypothetical protein